MQPRCLTGLEQKVITNEKQTVVFSGCYQMRRIVPTAGAVLFPLPEVPFCEDDRLPFLYLCSCIVLTGLITKGKLKLRLYCVHYLI